MAKKDELLKKMYEKVNLTSEEEFLKYLVDCCENVLESEMIMGEFLVNQGIRHPILMQLVKLRAEVSQRLETKYGIRHGKFINGESFLAKLARTKP